MVHAPIPSPDEIVRLYYSGELPTELARHHDKGEDGENLFLRHCITLHNGGDIDLVGLTMQSSFANLSGYSFFIAQNLYCKAIPELECEVSDLMECCSALVEKGGSDLAANLPNSAFRLWCQKKPSKAQTVISDARLGNALARKFATFALQAAGNVDQAIQLVEEFADDRRLSGMTGLGGIVYADAGDAHKALVVLTPYVAQNHDDLVRANAIVAAFNVLRQHAEGSVARKLIESATERPGPVLLHSLARIAWEHHAMLDSNSIALAVDAFKLVDPKHTGTVEEIDVALNNLLSTGHEKIVLDFLTAKLREPEFKIKGFNSTAHKLNNGDSERLYRLIVRWLLTGNGALRENVGDLVGVDEERVFDTTAEPLGLSPVQQIFLCRKAIGFLFLRPVTCCSIIVSVLRAQSAEARDMIVDLLFDPLLLSYGGQAREFLKRIPATDDAYGPVKDALVRADAYYASLPAAGLIKELHPSGYERGVVLQRDRDEARVIHKMAESKSIFANLFHRSTLLYGKRSLNFVIDGSGKPRSVPLDLKSYEMSFEFPRREILDPVGSNYLLRVFRVEELK